MQLCQLLSGFEAGTPQSVGNMTVIPLLSSTLQFDGIAGAENVTLARDTSYSSLHLKPIEEKLTIVPNGFTYLTKESAQDRTIPRTQVLTSGSREVQAYCVQSSQHGHMSSSRESDREIRLLPLAIKQHAFEVAPSNSQCGALWDKLRQYNASMNVSGDYLVSLFTKYAEQLEAFIAHFEPISGQRGAIILINGRVVGIDIFPSFHSYLQIWEKLIRDSYGAEAIHSKTEWTVSSCFPLAEPTSLEGVLQAVQNQKAAEKEWAYNLVTQCLNQEMEQGSQSHFSAGSGEKVTLSTVKSAELEGEVVYDSTNSQAVYVSLFRYAVAEKKVKAFSL